VVCLTVRHTSESFKNGGTDRDAAWVEVEDSDGLMKPCEQAILRA